MQILKQFQRLLALCCLLLAVSPAAQAVNMGVVKPYADDLNLVLKELRTLTAPNQAADYAKYLNGQIPKIRAHHEQMVKTFHLFEKAKLAKLIPNDMKEGAKAIAELNDKTLPALEVEMDRVEKMYAPIGKLFDALRDMND